MVFTELYKYKVELLWKLRTFLATEGFQEVPTPIVRKHKCDQPFPRFKHEGGGYLREAPAYGLRRTLQVFDKVFEIGTCFRKDKPDRTHLSEFQMLDLYSKDFTLEDALELAERVISIAYKGPIKRISMVNHIEERFGIDFYKDHSAEDLLLSKLKSEFGYDSVMSFPKILDTYIEDHIATTSHECCLILSDFPDSAETRAKRVGETLRVSKRFEFLVNGIEVIHGYEDETDRELLFERANVLGQFGPEEEFVSRMIKDGVIPTKSAGFGFGIERLCQVCLNELDIQKFIISREFI